MLMLFDDGFDTIELLTAIEEEFGVSIGDRDAEKLCTPSDVCEYLYRILNIPHAAESSRCLTAAAFFETRRRLVADIGNSDQRIYPNTPVEYFLPSRDRRAAWNHLGEFLNVSLPPLEFSNWAAMPPVCALGIILVTGLVMHSTILIGCFFVSLIPLMAGLAIAEHFFGYRVPRQYESVGALSAFLVPAVLRRAKSSPNLWNRDDIWQLIRSLTARAAAVPVSRIRPDTNFVRDLI
jgi:hypothetical protein